MNERQGSKNEWTEQIVVHVILVGTYECILKA